MNRGTRLLHHLVLTDKSYRATIRLGQSTVTDDAEGEVVATASAEHIDDADIARVLPRLTGAIEQVPASVSAIKVGGQRSYARVRAGEDVTLPARAVHVHRFDALGSARPEADVLDVDVEVDCSSGTYIRALARDLGVALGVGGHLRVLRRTRVGPFHQRDSRTLAELAAAAGPVVIDLPEAIGRAMPVRLIDDAEQRELSFGRGIAARDVTGTYGVLNADGAAVALVQEADGQARPVLVFTPAG